jgi:hypothetical protein
MCTVTFIPRKDTCFITSNRDETPDRQARGLTSLHSREWNAIHFPLDPSSGGSWIALADSGRTVCLLNGGFEPFIPAPPYRQSRGQVVIDAVSANHIDQFLADYEYTGIAPFTLLTFEQDTFFQLVWDGRHPVITRLSTDIPQIWSSVTLYPAEVRAWRKSLFEEWLGQHDTFDREAIIRFHQQANGDQENDFVMNRQDKVRTLSITSVQLNQDRGSILHVDLDHQTREEILIHYDG